MKTNVSLIKIEDLKQHEKIDLVYLVKLMKKIEKDNHFEGAIIVDKNSMVILDGHHRYNCCKQLGLSKIPCLLVDYEHDEKITVVTRRDEYKITKSKVVKMGKANNTFPHKTTKHFVPYKVEDFKVDLNVLK